MGEVSADLLEAGKIAKGTKAKARDVGLLQLVALTFFMTAGGPFGVEEAVQGGGVGPTLIGLAIAPLVYVIPQTLMTAELSTMMPENGGYIVWVCRGLGPFWGWLNGWNSALMNLFDNAIYPVLIIDYLRTIYPEPISRAQEMLFMGLVVAVGAFINFFKLRMIGNCSGLLAIAVMAPFTFIFFYTITDIDPVEQWTFEAPGGRKAQWASFVSTILWLHTGWNGLGSVSGEVLEDGGKVFTRTALLTAFLNFFVYASAVVSAATVSTADMAPDEIWNEAYLSAAYKRVVPAFGVWVVFTSAIDNLSLYFVNIGSTSRVLAKMADGGQDDEVDQGKISMLPPIFAWEYSVTGSPVIAILTQSALIMFLVQFDFNFLVQIDVFAGSISLLLEYAAFIRLRYTEPDSPRPYKIPGGLCVAWLCVFSALACVVVIGVLMAYYEYVPFLATVATNFVFVLMWLVRTKCFKTDRKIQKGREGLVVSSDSFYSQLTNSPGLCRTSEESILEDHTSEAMDSN